MEQLPCSLRHKINQHIYKNMHQEIIFFKDKEVNFITWLCPMLKSYMFTQETEIFNETEPVDSMYILAKGAAGFILPYS